jgi:predicted ATPase
MVRALELAERLNDAPSQLLLIYALYTLETRSGDARRLPELATRFAVVAEQVDDPMAEAIAHALFAVTGYYLGHYKEVLIHARIALSHPAHSSKLNTATHGYVHRIGARFVLSRSLWMLGYPEQAVEAAGQGLDEATDLGNPAPLVYALAWNVLTYLQTGNWPTAEQLITRLMGHANKYSLSNYYGAAVGWQGMLAVLGGDPSAGIELLQTALAALRADGYENHRSVFSAALAETLAKAGRTELAHTTICETVTWAENHCRSADLPELLRVKGEILTAMSPANSTAAEACLMNSLKLAREQSALSLELRTAMSLARLWAGNGRVDAALALLAPVHGQFSEGFQTPDLVAAAKLLDELRSWS